MSNSNHNRRPARWRRFFLIVAYLAVPAALLMVPTASVESGPAICLIKRVSGLNCPGCGMTRAFSHAMHGNLRQAIQHNILVLVVFPAMAIVWAGGLLRQIRPRCRQAAVTPELAADEGAAPQAHPDDGPAESGRFRAG
jgi:hypothetical protein